MSTPPGMNSPSSPNYSQQQQLSADPNQQGQGQQQQPQIRRLSPEEMRAFRECNRESFYYRSLPLSLAGLVGVRVLSRAGYLKPSPTTGFYMKYVAAVVLGYFAGKFSYLGKCRQKLMNLPNSELADSLRKSYGGGKRQLEVFQEMVTLPEMNTGSSQGGAGGDGYAPMRDGASDMYNNPDFVSGSPNAQQTDQGGGATSQKVPATSYDDLRRRNREEYLRQQFGVQSPAPAPSSSSGQQQQHSQGQQQQQQQPSSQGFQLQQYPSAHQDEREPSKPPAKSRFSYGSSPQSSATTKYGDVDFK